MAVFTFCTSFDSEKLEVSSEKWRGEAAISNFKFQISDFKFQIVGNRNALIFKSSNLQIKN